MLAKVRDKRIEQFKRDFSDFTVSKKGNLVYEKNSRRIPRRIVHSGLSVTKNTIKKIGTVEEFSIKTCDAVYVMTTTGKLMIKQNTKYFKNFTLRDLTFNPELKDTFFIGRKFEYLKEYPNLWKFRYFQNFTSLKEAKKHIDFGFISDEDFYSLFEAENDGWNTRRTFDTMFVLLVAGDKSRAYNLIKNLDKKDRDTLLDYLGMCRDSNTKPEIPAGKNRLRTLHDEMVVKINEKNADRYSKKVVYKLRLTENSFEDVWKERGLVFRKLESPYDMYLQGLRQGHCIGTSYYSRLSMYSFYSFLFDGHDYEIMISPDGRINQFYGRKNSNPPQELKSLVENIDYKHEIERIEGADLTDYPLIEVASTRDDELPF